MWDFSKLRKKVKFKSIQECKMEAKIEYAKTLSVLTPFPVDEIVPLLNIVEKCLDLSCATARRPINMLSLSVKTVELMRDDEKVKL